MTEYESVFVLNPDVEDSQVDVEIQKISEFLTSKECEITEVQKWGRRKLAYEIKKHKEGIYTLIRFNAEPGVPVELDRRYRLNESMLRFLTVVYEHPPVGEGTPEGEGEAESSGTPGPVSAAPGAAPATAAVTATATATAVAPGEPAPATEAAAPADTSGETAPAPETVADPAPAPAAETTDATADEETPGDDEKPSQE